MMVHQGFGVRAAVPELGCPEAEASERQGALVGYQASLRVAVAHGPRASFVVPA